MLFFTLKPNKDRAEKFGGGGNLQNFRFYPKSDCTLLFGKVYKKVEKDCFSCPLLEVGKWCSEMIWFSACCCSEENALNFRLGLDKD